jgi:hypothetical protein
VTNKWRNNFCENRHKNRENIFIYFSLIEQNISRWFINLDLRRKINKKKKFFGKKIQSKKIDSWRFRTHDWKKTTSQLQFRQFHWQFKKYIEKKLSASRIYRKAIKLPTKILEFSPHFSQSKFHQKSQKLSHTFSHKNQTKKKPIIFGFSTFRSFSNENKLKYNKNFQNFPQFKKWVTKKTTNQITNRNLKSCGFESWHKINFPTQYNFFKVFLGAFT